MSKINLTAKDWCDLVFEGRNKNYGAYRMRANHGRRQLRAIIILVVSLLAIMALIMLKSVVEQALANNADAEQVTEFSQLKKEEAKKEEKKQEQPKEEPKKEEPKQEVVQTRQSIQFTEPKIVKDSEVLEDKQLKTQEKVKEGGDIASKTILTGLNTGAFADDLKENQVAGTKNEPGVAAPAAIAPPKTTDDAVKKEVYNEAEVDVPASFPGGAAALTKYVSSHVKYPSIALDQELQGTVNLRFQVGADGSVSNVKVTKSLSRECDAEAMRVVRSLPKFSPAKMKGKPVAMWFNLPVRFQIQ